MPSEQNKTETFSYNYKRLNEIARQMEGMNEPDVDAILPLVQEAAGCKDKLIERIEQTRKALGQFKELEKDS